MTAGDDMSPEERARILDVLDNFEPDEDIVTALNALNRYLVKNNLITTDEWSKFEFSFYVRRGDDPSSVVFSNHKLIEDKNGKCRSNLDFLQRQTK